LRGLISKGKDKKRKGKNFTGDREFLVRDKFRHSREKKNGGNPGRKRSTIEGRTKPYKGGKESLRTMGGSAWGKKKTVVSMRGTECSAHLP